MGTTNLPVMIISTRTMVASPSLTSRSSASALFGSGIMMIGPELVRVWRLLIGLFLSASLLLI